HADHLFLRPQPGLDGRFALVFLVHVVGRGGYDQVHGRRQTVDERNVVASLYLEHFSPVRNASWLGAASKLCSPALSPFLPSRSGTSTYRYSKTCCIR